MTLQLLVWAGNPRAKNLTTFWENLKNGIETISFFSEEELQESGVSSQLFNQPNYVRARPILEQFEYFDSEFFGYTDREAELLSTSSATFTA
jgi:microcystin synthetase protein McyG